MCFAKPAFQRKWSSCGCTLPVRLLSSPPDSTFQLVCQFIQDGEGWGFQGSSSSMSYSTWGLHEGQRPRSVPSLREKPLVSAQQFSIPFGSPVGRSAHDYPCSWTLDSYTTEHLFHSWVMRGEGGVDRTSQTDSRQLSCWLSWIFCVRNPLGENPSTLTDLNCRAKQNRNRGLNFSSYFHIWNENPWGFSLCQLKHDNTADLCFQRRNPGRKIPCMGENFWLNM